MKPEDAWDAAHLEGALQAEQFLKTLLAEGTMSPEEARRHGDNAFVLVEFLANTYPRLPREMTERDAWLFLFEYYIAQGPFTGATTALAPESTKRFLEFVARRERVPELPYILEACDRREFFEARLAAFGAMARASENPKTDQGALDARVGVWFAELDAAMWRRGLVPDASIAGGEETWGAEMGPIETALFGAACVLLWRRARELRRAGVEGEAFDRAQLAAQREFMTRHVPGLGMTPLSAVLKERADLG